MKLSAHETVENPKEKRKKGDETPTEGPVRKKSRVFTECEADTRSSNVPEISERPLNGKKDVRKSGKKHNLDGKVSKKGPKADKSDPSSSTKRQTQKQKVEKEHDVKSASEHTNPNDLTVPSTSTKVTVPAPPCSTSIPISPQATSALHAEIRGMLIESMATSRASSLPASSLYRAVMQSRPALKAQRSEKEWLAVFELVLKEGQMDGGVFGKVESSGKVSVLHAVVSIFGLSPLR